MSKWQQFVKEHFHAVKAKHPNAKAPAILKILGKRWQKLKHKN